MSDFNLRDWAVKQPILGSDLQAHTDRLNGYTPLSFTGNVLVQGGMKHGMAVYVPFPPPQLPTLLPLLHITSAATGGGAYVCRRVKKASGSISASAGVTAGNLGEDEEEDVLAWNLDETDEGSHWLTHADNANKKYVQAIALWGTDDTGRTIYLIDTSWSRECTEGA